MREKGGQKEGLGGRSRPGEVKRGMESERQEDKEDTEEEEEGGGKERVRTERGEEERWRKGGRDGGREGGREGGRRKEEEKEKGVRIDNAIESQHGVLRKLIDKPSMGNELRLRWKRMVEDEAIVMPIRERVEEEVDGDDEKEEEDAREERHPLRYGDHRYH